MQLVKTKNVKSIVETLEASISDFMNSEKYLKYLRVMSKFHGYSMNNIFLILMQCPEASLVAGYKKWQTLGRHVKLGEFSSKEDAIRARKEGEKKYFNSVLEENQKS